MKITKKQINQMVINTRETIKEIFKEDFREKSPYKVIKKGFFKWGVVYRKNARVFFFCSFFELRAKIICQLMNDAYRFGTKEAIRYFNEFGPTKSN